MSRINAKFVRFLWLFTAGVLIVGCGGGGGSGGGTSAGGGPVTPTVPARETPLALAPGNAVEVQTFSQFALQQTTNLARTAVGLVVELAAAGGNTAQHQCFVGGSETATLTLLDRDSSASVSMGDRVDIDYGECGLTLINIPNLRGSVRVEVREFVRSKSGDVFVRARVQSVGDFRGLARRADPPNGVPNDINATMSFAFDVLTFGSPTLGRLQVMSAQDDAVVLRYFDGAAFDRLERLTKFEFEHRLGSDGRYLVTYKFDADADGLRVSLDNTRTIDLRGRFHCETTTPLSNQSSVAPNSGSAACTGARSSRQTATSDPTTFAGVFDLRVDPEGDGTSVAVVPPIGGRASWFIGELERYVPFRLPAIGAALPRTFARPALAFANPIAAVADRTSHTLYAITDRRLTAFDGAGNQLRSTALPFTLAGSVALSDDGSRVYVGGDDAIVAQLRAADFSPLANIALGRGGIPDAPRSARSIAVAPGTTDLLLVATDSSNELLAFRDGVQLPTTLPRGSAPVGIAFRNATTLIGIDADNSSNHLYTIDLLVDGPVIRTDLVNFVGAQPSSLIDVRNPVLTRAGHFIDIEGGVLTATLGVEGVNANHAGGALDPAGDFAYMLSRDGTLVVYEVARQARIRTYDLNAIGAPVAVVSLGDGTFAALGTSGIQYFTRTEVVASATLEGCNGFDLSDKFFAGTYVAIDCPLHDALFDRERSRLYATVRQQEGAVGNGFISVDPTNVSASTFTYVGSGADALRLSSDGNHLYVALAGASKLARVALGGTGQDATISLGLSPFFGFLPMRASAALELAGNADDLLISGDGRVTRYRGGARTAVTQGPVGTLLLQGSTAELVFAANDAGGITKLLIDETSIREGPAIQPGTLRGTLVTVDDRIYDSAGNVVNMSDLARTRTCNVVAQAVLPDLANDRIYYIRSDAHVANVTVCTLSSGAIRTREVPNFGSNLGDLRKAIDVGGGRFALLGSSGIVILAKADF